MLDAGYRGAHAGRSQEIGALAIGVVTCQYSLVVCGLANTCNISTTLISVTDIKFSGFISKLAVPRLP